MEIFILNHLGTLENFPLKYIFLQERAKQPLAAQPPSPQGFLQSTTISDSSLA